MRFETWKSAPVAYTNGVRRHPRTLFSVPITLDHLSGHEVRSSHGISLDISEGGMGALVQADLKVGDTVQIHLPLPKHYLTAVAIVRHSSKTCSGFEFIELTPEERSHIAVASAPSLPAI
jgi:c-di-GMP-binding flagellar brake protein YcgR